MNAKLGRLRGSTEANIGEPWNGQELSANERDATRTGQNVRALSASVRLPYSMTHLTSTPRRHARSRPLQTALGHSRDFFPRLSRQPCAPPAIFGPATSALTAMLARRALQGLARPLTRLSSTSTPVPTHEAPSPTAAAPQSPNFANTWSTSQRPRPQAHSGPRFEQTIMELQPNPLSAMEMINREPIRVVHGRKAVCDGGTSCPCILSPSRLMVP